MDLSAAERSAEAYWEQEILPPLVEYIRIPNKSPAFDADWHSKGHAREAASLIEGFLLSRAVELSRDSSPALPPPLL